MKSSAALGAVALGFLLLVGGGVWTKLFPGTSSWTPEKAARWSEVKDRVYTLSFVVHGKPRMHAGRDSASVKQEYDALLKENEQLKAEFESVATRPNTISKVLKWAGISLAVIGVIGWYAVKNTE
jgi:preprotein translocase subunit Sss1